MATISIPLTPSAAIPVGSAYPQLTRAGTNFSVDALAFDATTAETCTWPAFRAPGYVSGGTVRVTYYANATTGAAVFAAGLVCLTPGTDSTDMEALSLPTFTQATGATFAATAKRPYETTITLSAGSLNSIAGTDAVYLFLRRVAADAADTATVDAQVVSVVLEYADV